MTRQEWDQKWWEKYLSLRRASPNSDLLQVHAAATKWMNSHYGERPAGESGPPWWAMLGAAALGVPTKMLKTFWDFMNGKKTIVGAVITVAAALVAVIPPVLAAVGVEATQVAAIVGVATTVLGIAHKIYKYLYGEEHP